MQQLLRLPATLTSRALVTTSLVAAACTIVPCCGADSSGDGSSEGGAASGNDTAAGAGDAQGNADVIALDDTGQHGVLDDTATGVTDGGTSSSTDATASKADTNPGLNTDTAGLPDAGQSPFPSPLSWGPYPVGTRLKDWTDPKRNRKVTTRLWYPITEKDGVGSAVYFELGDLVKVQGKARNKGSADGSLGPRPVVVFSHGFKGIHWQSYAFTEYLASHGFVVAAPDHVGNTLFDFSASKETESKSALERPRDVLFVLAELGKLNDAAGQDFHKLLDLSKVAVAGHSFGGYTTLVNAGAVVDVDTAKQGCKTAKNMLCKGGYMDAWPDGSEIKAEAAIPGLKAAICLAPGFHVAFGDKGLAKVTAPVLMFGGSLDGTTPVKEDIDPMYKALPKPKAKVVITGASHMSYTNICSLPPVQLVPQLKEMCVKPGLIDVKQGFAITNALAVAWLRRWLQDDKAQDKWLVKAGAESLSSAISFESQLQ